MIGLDTQLLISVLKIDPAGGNHGGQQHLSRVQVEVAAGDVTVGGHDVGEFLQIDRQRPPDRLGPLDPGEELGAEDRIAVLVAPAESIAQGRHHRGELAAGRVPAVPAPRRVDRVPCLEDGLADLLERMVGVDPGQRRDERAGVARGSGGPHRPQVDPLGFDLAEGHEEGAHLLLLGAHLLARQGRVIAEEILVVVAGAPVLVG